VADDEEPWAAQRDASWYGRPDVRSFKMTHVAGQPIREGIASRCGRSVLNEDMTWALSEVPVRARCRANGCRQAWPVEVPPE
jgi:hypothetical protein